MKNCIRSIASCFIILSTSCHKSIDFKNEVNYEYKEISDLKPWRFEYANRLDGDYTHSAGSFSAKIILMFYYDIELDPPGQFDCVVIETENLAIKPSFRVIQGMIHNKEKDIISNGDVTMKLLEVKFSGKSEWIRGILYEKKFYKVFSSEEN